ncbi:plexin-A1-like [Saccostrea echinata]|uniref:plexin-A1-like n=1 Tax=Saccostrea echinata TaxID=191078 RepID=UPI002A804F06|nr:plexin-A1-like [Saccostrea echinata]
MVLLIVVLLVTVHIHIFTSLINKSPITGVLQNPNVHYDFTHMIAHDANTVIVGGTKFIHIVFARNLSIKISRKIGPQIDNPNCISLQKRTAPVERKNVSTLELLPGLNQMSRAPIVANNSTATTVAFLAPGPKNSTAMYVGASWTNTRFRGIRSLVPAFSSRNIVDFDFTYASLITKPYTMVDSIYKDSFPIRYIYGFELENFSYIATVQRQHVTAVEYVSKLIRVCQSDEKFYSYAERSLSCLYRGKSYNLLQTAHISKPGQNLARELGIPENEGVLFGMFGYGNPNDYSNKAEESVLCIFPNYYIKQVFTRNTRKCFQGIGKTGPDHIVTPYYCQLTKINIGDDCCGEYDFNNPMDGPEPVSSTGVISLDITASSLMVTTTSTGHNVAFVGTSSGKVKKIKIQTSSILKEYDEVVVDVGIPIMKFIFDIDNQDTLYMLTPKKVNEYRIQIC